MSRFLAGRLVRSPLLDGAVVPEPVHGRNTPLKRKGIAYWVCYGLCHLFSKTPLKRYGLRAKALGGRFENRANYVADRISKVEAYRRAFRSFANFGNQTAMQ